MKASAYIFLLSLMMLGTYPMIQHLQNATEQVTSCCDACCCDNAQDSCDHKDSSQEEDKGHDCHASCDCGCQFHLNAVQFQFRNMQIAEEQEFHFGEYVNAYDFEYYSLHIPPPRLG